MNSSDPIRSMFVTLDQCVFLKQTTPFVLKIYVIYALPLNRALLIITAHETHENHMRWTEPWLFAFLPQEEKTKAKRNPS